MRGQAPSEAPKVGHHATDPLMALEKGIVDEENPCAVPQEKPIVGKPNACFLMHGP